MRVVGRSGIVMDLPDSIAKPMLRNGSAQPAPAKKPRRARKADVEASEPVAQPDESE